jgi:high-affinity iron transporter
MLEDARAALGDGASQATIVTNAAIVVFREGLEAVLILAAVLAGMTGATGRLRRPIWVGVVAAIFASVLTFILAQTVLDQFSQYGEKLEAVVGLVAIAVLLVVLNWFLHKVYWSNWISGFNRKRKEIVETAGAGLLTGQAVGLILLGFSMTYREGFETVLFLQALALEAGIAAVLEGTAIGLAAVFAVGFATFALERRLPYKKMLILTGLLIGLVLVILVGNTARTMQGVGWLSITPIDVDMPYWLGLWFGVYPTVETIGAQIAAAAFVIGSYYAAEWVRKRHVRRAAREALTDTAKAEDRVGSTRSRTRPEPTEENLGRRPAEANPPVLGRARRGTGEDRAVRDSGGVAGGEGDRQGGRVLQPLLRDRGRDGEG